MEEVISLYTEEGDPDPARPYVCFDETSKQLVAETRTPLPPRSGQPERFDYEYERRGTANIFMLVAPRLDWRQVNVTARRTRVDFAFQMRLLVDDYFPQAETIRVVLDNLNTHNPASLYEAFAPEEAKRILDRLEFVHTPKHASWLNMAEIELSLLSRQCLKARVPDAETLRTEINAWQAARAYESDAIRAMIAAAGKEAVIPPRANRVEPPDYDKEKYKERNKAERLFCKLKGYRGVATRYDKLAAMFLGGTLSALLAVRLRSIVNTP